MVTEPKTRAKAPAPGKRAAPRKKAEASGTQPNQALSQARVLEVAIRIGDEESLDELTMRRLANDLGVGTMTLYSYFRNKTELLDGWRTRFSARWYSRRWKHSTPRRP